MRDKVQLNYVVDPESFTDSFRRKVRVDVLESKQPKPQDLIIEATRIKEAPKSLSASDYGKATDILRQKGYTWLEIASFFRKQGADYSMQAIVAGWRNWKKNKMLNGLTP